MISPHHKNNLQPLRSQSPKGLGMVVASGPLVSIKGLGPLASVDRDKSKPVDSVAQLLVTRKTKLNDATLATRFGHRDCSRLSLKVLKGFPSIWGISQLGPKRWQQRSAFSSRQLLHKPSRRCRGEKTFDLVAVRHYLSHGGLKLIEQHFEQLRLGCQDVVGNHKLRLFQLLPQLRTARFTVMTMLLSESVPLLTAKLRERRWGRILLEKIHGYTRLQIPKNLHGARIVLLESDLELIEQPRFVAHHSLLIPSKYLKLLGLLRVWPKGSEVTMVGPKKFRQYPSIKGIALRLTHTKPVPSTIQDLRIDRVNHHPTIQKKIYNSSVGLLDRRPQLNPFSSALIEPVPHFRHPFRALLEFHFHYLCPVLITPVQLVHSVSPIYSQIVSRHFVVLLRCLFYSNSCERNVSLISVLDGTTFHRTFDSVLLLAGTVSARSSTGIAYSRSSNQQASWTPNGMSIIYDH